MEGRNRMKKLAVFFPGIGYTVDKPLLYYSRKIAAEQGYAVEELPAVVGGHDVAFAAGFGGRNLGRKAPGEACGRPGEEYQ